MDLEWELTLLNQGSVKTTLCEIEEVILSFVTYRYQRKHKVGQKTDQVSTEGGGWSSSTSTPSYQTPGSFTGVRRLQRPDPWCKTFGDQTQGYFRRGGLRDEFHCNLITIRLVLIVEGAGKVFYNLRDSWSETLDTREGQDILPFGVSTPQHTARDIVREIGSRVNQECFWELYLLIHKGLSDSKSHPFRQVSVGSPFTYSPSRKLEFNILRF